MLLLLLSVSLVHAEGPDQEYIRIYNLIIHADSMTEKGETRAAAEQYREAETALKKLNSIYPQWNEVVVKFRLDYLAQKLESSPQFLTKTNAIPSIPVTETNAALPANALSEEIRRLQSDKTLLEAKLKEALSVRSNSANSNDLAKVEEKMTALEKERDLLKVSLEQESVAKKAGEQEAIQTKRLQELELQRDELQQKLAAASSDKKSEIKSGPNDKELEKLRARLDVLEARPDPYTAEELALFKKPSQQVAPVEAKPVKKSRELPAGAGALVAQAERAFAARRFDEAEKKYLEVLRQDENNVYILGNLAATQLEMDNVAESEKNIKRALEVDPEDGFSLTLLGMVKFRQNKFDEALDVLSRSAQINPNNPETQNYLGITLSQKGQRVAAEAALRKAIKIQPNYGGAHHNLAVIYATQKPPFFELARWHYEKALALNHPKNRDLEKILAGDK